jgi:hypothetical protein
MNDTALANLIAAARTQRVGVLICSDSNVYTYGGWQQALPMALRNYAPICGYANGIRGQSAINGAATPGFSAADKFAAGGQLQITGFATTGAPAAHAAMFPENAAGRGYYYVADGVSNANASNAIAFTRFSGLDARRAFTIKVFGISFETGATAAPMPFYWRSVAPSVKIGADAMITSVTGAVARMTTTLSVAANAARDATLSYDCFFNVSPKLVGPIMLTGYSIVDTALTSGWVLGTHCMMGGNSSAENIDDMIKSRASYRESLQQMRDTLGADSTVLVLTNFINDKTLRTTSASSQYTGLVTAGDATTVTVDDAIGLAAGMRITLRDATTLGYVDANSTSSVQDRVILSVVGNIVTVTVAWTRNPVAGDVWRASAAAATQPTQAGRLNSMTKYRAMMVEDCTLAGLTPLFVDLPQWPSGTDDALVVQFEAASDQMAAAHADWVSLHPSEWFSVSQVVANSGADTVHPGSYCLASFLQRAVTVVQANAAAAGAAAQLAADQAAVASELTAQASQIVSVTVLDQAATGTAVTEATAQTRETAAGSASAAAQLAADKAFIASVSIGNETGA